MPKNILETLIDQVKVTGEAASALIVPKDGLAPCKGPVRNSPSWRSSRIIDAQYCVISKTPKQPSLFPLSYDPFASSSNAATKSLAEKSAHLLQKFDRSGLPEVLKQGCQALFFIALVEDEFAFRATPEMRAQIIAALGGLGSEGAREWSLYMQSDVGIIHWASRKLNRTPTVVAMVLGHLLGLRPEYCFTSFPPATDIENRSQTGRQVRELIPDQLGCLGRKFELKAVDRQKDISGIVEQAVCLYGSGKEEIFVIATRFLIEQGGLTLKIGAEPANSWLFSRDLIALHPSADLFICLDNHHALHFRRIAREGRVLDRTGVIVSGFFGCDDALKSLVLSDVAGHRVILLSSPGQSGWESIPKLAKGCIDNGAASVEVYPWPLIIDDRPLESSLDQDGAKALWAEAVDIRAVELPSRLVANIKAKAMPFDTLKEWTKIVGLEAADAPDKKDTKNGLRFVSLSEIPDKSPLAVGPSVYTSGMFNSSYTTLIWGPSNAGKSWVAVEIAVALATGTSCFFLAASAPIKVGYLDGEMGGADFKIRCVQLMQGRAARRDFLDENLNVVPTKGGLNILDAQDQKAILSGLVENRIKLFVIDNILSLAPAASKSNATPLFDFINLVERQGIAVLMAHHAGKSAKDFKGPVDLVSLSQNVLHLEGRDQIAEHTHEEDAPSEVLTAALADDGPVVRIIVDKCKVAPHLERKKYIYRLPVGESWELVEGEVDNGDAATDTLRSVEAANSLPESVAPAVLLPPDAVKVLDAMQNRLPYYRSDIEKCTNYKGDRVLKSLNLLIEARLVSREVKGRSTFYRKI
ncbi:MAG: AAA family ATPase [Desulfovibrionaceae bacterium]